MLTSDPTSDSSDTGGSGKSNDETNGNAENHDWNGSSANNSSENGTAPFVPPSTHTENKLDMEDTTYYVVTSNEHNLTNNVRIL
jgi:hypothetical protein